MWEKIGEVVIVQVVIGDGVIVQPLYIWEGPVKLELFFDFLLWDSLFNFLCDNMFRNGKFAFWNSYFKLLSDLKRVILIGGGGIT